MYRKIIEKLNNWKKSSERYPLLILGARQVGKTYIIKQFAEDNYKKVIYINFENDERYKSFFDVSLRPSDIIKKIENHFNEIIELKDTCIIFDEIQIEKRALTSLKYFCEDMKEANIICAGSLLGVSLLRENASFPVGKVEMMNMYPFSFEEFLIAQGRESLVDEIKMHFERMEAMDEDVHNILIDYYLSYIALGGMPKVIDTYIETNSYIKASKVCEQIYNAYINDMQKYAGVSQVIKNRECYNSIAKQLLKENKNFKYSEVMHGKNKQYFDNSINWLIEARVVLKLKLVTTPRIPLSFHEDEFLFRLYLSDVGLIRYFMNTNINNILNKNYRDDMIGILTENYVAMEFVNNEKKLYYWKGKANAEIEFLIEENSNVIPVEVKTGVRTTSKSLDVYRNINKIPYAYRLSRKNFGYENGIKSVPLYAAFCI